MSDRGVYRLANAMLLQAIHDAISNSSGRRRSAFRWMNGKAETCFSFAFVCRVVSRDPEEVRRFCLRKVTQQQMPRVAFRSLVELPPPAVASAEQPAWARPENSDCVSQTAA